MENPNRQSSTSWWNKNLRFIPSINKEHRGWYAGLSSGALGLVIFFKSCSPEFLQILINSPVICLVIMGGLIGGGLLGKAGQYLYNAYSNRKSVNESVVVVEHRTSSNDNSNVSQSEVEFGARCTLGI